MSKCEIQIVFGRPDRTYRGGDTVSGEVHIQVNQDIRSNGIVLTHFWRTHGRGNRHESEKHTIRLSEMVPLQAGEELVLPFEFVAQRWPLTYHGHFINVDHYVHVAVDVSWAIDPKHEEEYIVLAGMRPPELTGERGAVVPFHGQTTQLTGPAKIVVFALLGLLVLILGVFFLFLLPVFLFGGGVYWFWKKMIASRVGEVELKIPHVVVGPGETLPVELSFTPRKSFSINSITATLTVVEAATSGSGTNATTHRHTLHETKHMLRSTELLMAGELVHDDFEIPIPNLDAWSLNVPSNKITWVVEVRIDIPRFPDWSRRTDLQMIPGEFLTAHQHAVTDSSALPFTDPSTEDRATQAGTTFTASSNAGSGHGEDIGPLLALVDEIERVGRFGNERSEIVAAATGHIYNVAVTIDRVATTYGFSGTDHRYERGRTVVGTIPGTSQPVQIYTLESNNSVIDRLSRGELWSALATIETWDTLYRRMVMYQVTET
ncbi:MAG: sporulation protein [Planctomycetaceae bacterium]